MEFGIFFEIPVPRPWDARSEYRAYQRVLEETVFAEEMGFSSFWTVEHHFLDEFSHCSSPEVLYGAVAQATKTMRIGHAVRLLPFPYNHPVRAAEMAATLDLISGGRLDFGTGRSISRAELEGFGIDPDDTRSMWAEAMELIVGAWTNEQFEWDGAHFKLPKRCVVPKPLQQPHPPLWMAAGSPESHGTAGRLGLGLLSLTLRTPIPELKDRIDRYRAGLLEAEPVGSFINDRAAVFVMAHCADTDEQAQLDSESSIQWYLNKGIEYPRSLAEWSAERAGPTADSYQYLSDLASVPDLSYETMCRENMIIAGSPQRCIEAVKEYQSTGLDQLLCLMNPYNISHEAVMHSIELFGKHVIPEFS
jgi:alkanesulfonate monooxygenase SsuD/methylene tetrahydromethanopterin reductase-like flavin-dependent oxidoreductase (luciferase family)